MHREEMNAFVPLSFSKFFGQAYLGSLLVDVMLAQIYEDSLCPQTSAYTFVCAYALAPSHLPWVN